VHIGNTNDTTHDSWYWPTIVNVADAKVASNQGVWAAVFVAGITTVIATITVFTKSNLVGINPYTYIDAALFALIAWSKRRRSKAFAVAVLGFFVFEKIYQLTVQPQIALLGSVMSILFLLLFINSVRGTFAFHRLARKTYIPRIPVVISRSSSASP